MLLIVETVYGLYLSIIVKPIIELIRTFDRNEYSAICCQMALFISER